MAKDYDASENEGRNVGANLSYGDAFVRRDHFRHSRLILKGRKGGKGLQIDEAVMISEYSKEDFGNQKGGCDGR